MRKCWILILNLQTRVRFPVALPFLILLAPFGFQVEEKHAGLSGSISAIVKL
jgi:hypothetical protein